ncbi:hypothetical protein [Pseudolactococcus reticulitermitis]|uniref:DUF4854 domain-containing protein n=1 Tax=Pseudolactococcus reticulitermitis TaxID=2025039 RepID=A0A224XEZ1_9LACT|nr:hypothetical protein [Lactococcus reticulitermitis]GAX48195.1 hypothetical protein RsY01_1810 [Lactococcus reticulitermitis]
MKKQIAILLSATALLTGLAACSSKPSTDSSADKKTETVKKSSKSEEKKASSEAKDTSKTSSSDKSASSDNFDLMIEGAQSQTDTLKKQFGDMFSDITITKGDGHTLVYTYTYAKDPGVTVDAEALKPTLVKGMKPVLNTLKAIAPDAKIQVIYLKPDHTELANITITQEDTDNIS